MQIRIEATDLPGRDWTEAPGRPEHRDVRVAVQRRNHPGDLLDARPGDSPAAAWTLLCGPPRTTATGTDFTGPYIQGSPGGRFVYLSWCTPDAAGAVTVFRRAKLMLDAVDPATAEAAVRSGLLVARLRLTDARGGPLCAAVRPPLIEWSAPPS
ncbi:DUF5990 family protein [Kitasatospora sp. NBC_00315]|uniref:DUF5990 family protein n=1 Tax=Kitasatospora sp. NBC_00315 TaxID=2975963 RepID=UPI00324BBC2B